MTIVSSRKPILYSNVFGDAASTNALTVVYILSNGLCSIYSQYNALALLPNNVHSYYYYYLHIQSISIDGFVTFASSFDNSTKFDKIRCTISVPHNHNYRIRAVSSQYLNQRIDPLLRLARSVFFFFAKHRNCFNSINRQQFDNN